MSVLAVRPSALAQEIGTATNSGDLWNSSLLTTNGGHVLRCELHAADQDFAVNDREVAFEEGDTLARPLRCLRCHGGWQRSGRSTSFLRRRGRNQ